MLTYLKRPSPIDYTTKLRLILSLGIPLFIFGFLFIFRPFGLFEEAEISPILATAGFGLIAFLCVAFMLFGWSNFWMKRMGSNWSIGYELFAIFLLVSQIGVLNHVFIVEIVCNQYYANHSLLSSFLISLGMTYAVAFFPVAFILILYEANWRGQDNFIPSQNQPHDSNEIISTIIVEGQTKENAIELSSESFLFAKAAGNYVEFYSQMNGDLRKDLQRITMAKLEDLFMKNEFPALKTHRGYIINLKKVLHFEGNAQGYSLDFGAGIEKVPVSRKQIPDFDRVMNG